MILSSLALALAAAASGAPTAGRVFLVGGSPVLAGWSLPAAAAVTSQPSAAQAPNGSRPPGGPHPFHGHTGRNEAPPPHSALRASSAALGAFLAAVLLFWLLGPPWPGNRNGPDAHPPAADPALEASLRSELAALKGRYEDRMAACRPAEPSPPEEPEIEEGPPSLPDPERAEAGPPDVETAPAPLEAAARGPAAGDGLVLPEDFTLASIEGCWATLVGHRDSRGREISYVLCFDAAGKGSASIERLDKGGRVTDVCNFSASASVRKGAIQMERPSRPCRSGFRYVGDSIRCRPVPGKEASCQIKHHGGNNSWYSVRLTYRGRQ
jgi:hypothetical protein